MSEFGELIRNARERMNLRAFDVAFSLGQSPSWVSKLESGQLVHPPDPSVLLALSDILGVPEIDMFRAMGYRAFGEDSPPYDADTDALIRSIQEMTPSQRAKLKQVIKILWPAHSDI